MNYHISAVQVCRFATSRHSDFAALRHDVLKRFKGASLYKVVRDVKIRGELVHEENIFY
jgi:hypothetical protein